MRPQKDYAPQLRSTAMLRVAGVLTILLALPFALAAPSTTLVFEDDGEPANTFFPEDSTLALIANGLEVFEFSVTVRSDVSIQLAWTGTPGADDIDLYLTGPLARSSTQSTPPLFNTETIVVANAPPGAYDIFVDPVVVGDVAGARYTLIAEISPVESD